MKDYTFKGAKFEALLRYALALKGAKRPYTQTACPPGLYFVKDQGAYLMPAGNPPANAKTNEIKIHDRKYILYFPGFTPSDSRAELVEEFGGDDFAVYIKIPKVITKGITLTIRDSSFTWSGGL